MISNKIGLTNSTVFKKPVEFCPPGCPRRLFPYGGACFAAYHSTPSLGATPRS